MTRRQLIIKLLKENKNPLSLNEIAVEMFIDKKTVLEDLSHIAKTLKGKGKFQLIIFFKAWIHIRPRLPIQWERPIPSISTVRLP